MGKPKAPPPPDPARVAGAQTAQNIGTAIAQQSLNNVNQVTPDGTLTYGQTGSQSWTDPNTGKVFNIPTYTATQTLSEPGQAVRDQQDAADLNLATLANEQSGRLGTLLGTPVDLGGRLDKLLEQPLNLDRGPSGRQINKLLKNPFEFAPSKYLGTSVDISNGPSGRQINKLLKNQFEFAPSKYLGTSVDISNDAVEGRLMELGRSRLDPALDRRREALRTSLSQQGIKEGSEAYDRAMMRATEGENDAYNQLLLSGRGQAVNEALASRSLAGQEELALRDQALSARGQAFQEALSGRGQAFNEALVTRTLAGQEELALRDQALGARGQAFQEALSGREQAVNEALVGRNQALKEALMDQQQSLTTRNQPINEITALMSGSQVSMPNFINPNTPNLANVDRAGLEMQAYNANHANWQARMQNRQSLLGGLFGLGGKLGAAKILA